MDYAFTFSVDLGKVVPSVGGVIDEVNRHMNGFGFPEKMVVRSEALVIVAHNLRPDLPPEDLAKVADVILADLKKFRPEWAIQYEGVRPYSSQENSEPGV